MLVMSRRQGETILIGEHIEIVITQIGRSRVKVGIRAPRKMPVIAREFKLVREENRAAAGSTPASVSGWIAHLQPATPTPLHPQGCPLQDVTRGPSSERPARG
jgi:carbon storage regulator